MSGPVCKWLMLLAPRDARDWIAAMVSEASYAPEGDRWQWHLAILRLALTARLRSWSSGLQACALAAAMIAIDWRSGAFLPSFALMALSAVVLTRGGRRDGLTAPIVAGGTLPMAHALANWVPTLRPDYQYAPLRLVDWAILLTVGAIGMSAVKVAESFSGAPSLRAADS